MTMKNPYDPPEVQAEAQPQQDKERKMPFWQRHLLVAIGLFPLWFMVGGPIAIGGSPTDQAIDSVGWLICFLYLAFALLAGVVTGLVTVTRRSLK